MADENSEHLHIRIPPGLLQATAAAAKRRPQPLSWYVREALEEKNERERQENSRPERNVRKRVDTKRAGR